MVSIGTGLGSAEELVFAYDGMRAKGLRAVSPLVVQMYMPNGAAAVIVTIGGRPFSVMAFTVANGKIVEIDAIADPERIRRIAGPVLDELDR